MNYLKRAEETPCWAKIIFPLGWLDELKARKEENNAMVWRVGQDCLRRTSGQVRPEVFRGHLFVVVVVVERLVVCRYLRNQQGENISSPLATGQLSLPLVHFSPAAFE